MQNQFVGRKEELHALRGLLDKKSASLVTLKGRRRVGKSRLIKEFAKGLPFYNFSGLPPTKKTTEQTEREEFARQLSEKFGLPGLKANDWGDLFTVLAKQVEKGRIILLLDEISWMASKDPSFLGKLKNAWDTQFSNNSELILILCGSVSVWIEENIINSTGFMGRPSLYITLEELPLLDCNQFWGKRAKVSPYEKFKTLSVTGGIPRYLELMNLHNTAEENIRRHCFTKNGALVNEFEHIFTDIFSKKNTLYKRIVEILALGIATQETLAKQLNISQSGELSKHLNDLVLSGFISRDSTWNLKTENISNLSHYRLKDNYIRFYLKYILPNKPKIEKGYFESPSSMILPGWDSIMGLQFENLVLNNHKIILQLLGIPFSEVAFDNPYFQRKTKRQSGCQIDYLIQTRFNNVYICEIKYSRKIIDLKIIDEMKEKINRLSLPRHYSYRPVLIHVNGINEDVIDSEYFYKIIDFGQLLIS